VRRGFAGLVVAASLAVGAGAAPRAEPPAPAARATLHPDSFSQSLVAVEPDGLHVFHKLQALSVFEVLPAADPDGDLYFQQQDLEAVRDDLVGYVLERYLLRPAPGAEPLVGRLVSCALLREDTDALAFQQFVELDLRY